MNVLGSICSWIWAREDLGGCMGAEAPPSKILLVLARKLVEGTVQVQLHLKHAWAIERDSEKRIANLF